MKTKIKLTEGKIKTKIKESNKLPKAAPPPAPKPKQIEISDKDIRKAAKKYATTQFGKELYKDEWEAVRDDFIAACKWYREQLKQGK